MTEKWSSRKFWSHVAAAILVVGFAWRLEVAFVRLLEAKLITGEIYSGLASGVFWTAAVFVGAAVGIYTVSNVVMEGIKKR